MLASRWPGKVKLLLSVRDPADFLWTAYNFWTLASWCRVYRVHTLLWLVGFRASGLRFRYFTCLGSRVRVGVVLSGSLQLLDTVLPRILCVCVCVCGNDGGWFEPEAPNPHAKPDTSTDLACRKSISHNVPKNTLLLVKALA